MARKQTAHVKICAPGYEPPEEGEEVNTRIHDPDNQAPEPNLLQEAMESWLAFKNKHLTPKVKKDTGS